MSEIIKTEALVLSKLNYGDTSSIVTFYSESNGKITAIVKGGRSSKSKIGKVVDPVNHLQIIIYKKDTREIQILSSADLLSYFPKLKEDLDTSRYAFAIIELVKNLTLEGDSNKRLFKGIVKILNLLDKQGEKSSILFTKFFLFFLSELGYELVIDKCGICDKALTSNELDYGFNLELGFICPDCFRSHDGFEKISAELFNYIFCLKINRKISTVDENIIDKLISLLERYLKYHVPDFKGIQSLKIYR